MRLLITAGGTREYLDSVRFISNASSGRMGYALAEAAVRGGHEVTLVSAPAAVEAPKGVKLIKVESAGEMFAAVKKYFNWCDCLIMAAAVSDWTPVKRAKKKIKKTGKSITIKLKPTADILKWAGREIKNQISNIKNKKLLVGFALEDKNLRANAEKKMRAKGLDVIIANEPAAIGAERSEVQIKTVSSRWKKMLGSKRVIAEKVTSLIEGISAERK